MLPLQVQIALEYWKAGERTVERMTGLIIHVCEQYCITGEHKEHLVNIARAEATRQIK